MWLALLQLLSFHPTLNRRHVASINPPPRRSSSPRLTLNSPFPSPDLGGVSGEGDAVQNAAAPLRTMVFIDGSWLYYSFHGRRPNCPVTAAYGRGWEYSNSIDFDRLPQLISQYVHAELFRRFHTQRFVEIVRTVVFSSARADTHKDSTRMRMFRQMEESNFEVHMSTTTGYHEKCIDISLAVEMMHYASVPGAYDVAVIVSGDKDFIPALARIRQKGKRVALCSMRNCCSRDLLDPSAHCRDFDPIWLDDHLEYLIRPNPGQVDGQPLLGTSELVSIITSFLKEQPIGAPPVSSRDIGRFLQGQVGKDGRDALTQLKQQHQGLRSFFTTFNDKFEMSEPSEDDRNTGVTEFFVTLTPKGMTAAAERGGNEEEDDEDDQQEQILMDAKIGSGKDSAAASSAAPVPGAPSLTYPSDPRGGAPSTAPPANGEASSPAAFEGLTVPELRELLRSRGLPALGRKAELLERLQQASSSSGGKSDSGGSAAAAANQKRPKIGVPHPAGMAAAASAAAAQEMATVARGLRPEKAVVARGTGAPSLVAMPRQAAPRVPFAPMPPQQRTNNNNNHHKPDRPRSEYADVVGARLAAQAQQQEQARDEEQEMVNDQNEARLVQTVVSYLEGRDGVASSRNVGRHLAAYGLLAALKQRYAGLFHFLQKNDELFTVVLPEERGAVEYRVHLNSMMRGGE